MALTFFLAKVLGLWLLIAGIGTVLRRRALMPAIAGFAAQPLLRLLFGTAMLLAGLFLVIAHNQWSPLPAALISLFGWIAVIESAAYLVLPDALVARLIAAFNNDAWYIGGGIFAIALGGYLAAFGFGLVN